MRRSRIIAVITDVWAEPIMRACSPTIEVQLVQSAEDALSRLQAGQVDGLVIDATLAACPTNSTAIAAMVRSRRIPCVLCAELSPTGMQSVLTAASLRPQRLLLAGVDDQPASIRDALRTMLPERLSLELLEVLEVSETQLTDRVWQVVRRVTAQPEAFFDACDVSREVGMSRRNVDRVLRASGIASARRLVVAARVWHAVHRVVERDLSLTEAAESLGYASRLALTRHLREVLGENAACASAADLPALRRSLHEYVREQRSRTGYGAPQLERVG